MFSKNTISYVRFSEILAKIVDKVPEYTTDQLEEVFSGITRSSYGDAGHTLIRGFRCGNELNLVMGMLDIRPETKEILDEVRSLEWVDLEM